MSVLLDSGARRLLERAYASPGQWVTTRLADPSPEHVRHFAAEGIDVYGPDNAPRRGGRGLNAHTRWCRAFVRAVYYQHLWYSNTGRDRGWRGERRTVERTAGALKLEIGRHMPPRGVIPSGRIVRAVLYPGGQAADRAVGRPTGSTAAPYGGAAADSTRRDW